MYECFNSLHRLRDSLLPLVPPSGDLRLVTDTTKNKPQVDYEPRSAHGRAVKENKNKSRVNLEPRSAHGRAVKNTRSSFELITALLQKMTRLD